MLVLLADVLVYNTLFSPFSSFICFYYVCQGGYIFIRISLFVCWQDYAKTTRLKIWWKDGA